MRCPLFFALLPASLGAGGWLPSQVGTWGAMPSLLPNSKLPDAPLLGHGALGMLLDSHAAGPARNATLGPGRPGVLDIWLGSAAAWSCRVCTGPAAGCCGMVSLGGVSIAASVGSSELAQASFSQVLANATLSSVLTAPDGSRLATTTRLHPTLNILATSLLYTAPAGGGAAMLEVSVSTWVAAASGAHAAPAPVAAGCADASGATPVATPCRGGGGPALAQVAMASRAASTLNGAPGGPRPVWLGLASVAVGAPVVGAHAATAAGGTWGAALALQLTAGVEAWVVTAEAEAASYAPEADPALAAAALAAAMASPAGVAALGAASTAWWAAFWAQSAVALPSQPTAEALFAGAQYVLACTASTNASVPPPALYGVWVTSDSPAWVRRARAPFGPRATAPHLPLQYARSLFISCIHFHTRSSPHTPFTAIEWRLHSGLCVFGIARGVNSPSLS